MISGVVQPRLRFFAALALLRAEPKSSNHSSHLALLAFSANRRLDIIGSGDRINNAISPDIRPKFGEGESRIQFHNPLAKVRAGLSRPARTQIQVADGNLKLLREGISVSRFRCLEVGFEVHASSIDHFDLLEQIFLGVDQNDLNRYAPKL